MSRTFKIGLIAFVVVMVILIVWLSSGSNNASKNGGSSTTATTYTNWDDAYIPDSKDPKGLFHWSATLRLHLQKNKSISTIDYLYSIDTIPKETQPTFLFIGDYFALYEEEIDSLLSKVGRGAKLFISAEKVDGLLYEYLFDDVVMGYYYDTTITVATATKTYPFTALHQAIPVAKKWIGYKFTQTVDSVPFKSLSGYGTLMNSGVIDYGAGKIYLNTTPELFTNYQYLTTPGYAYAKTWLNEIPKDQSVYWLEFARYKPYEYDFMKEYYGEDGKRDDSYLQFIFQDRQRILALLLLISGLILFVLFRAKRMQPFVPFIPKKRNMTMIFADTITSIYFNQRNPFAMVRIQRANFYGIIHKHFHIDLSKEVTEREIESLAQKSNVKPSEINEILRKMNALREYNTSEYELSELRKMILNFYRKSGLISTKIQDRLDVKIYQVYRNEWISGLLILVGLGLITYGTYYLTHAIAIGVVLWPIGAIPIIFGVMRLMKPYLSWSNREISIQPLFGKEKVFNLEQLRSVYQDRKEVQLHFESVTLKVNYWELNRADAKQLQRFAETHNKMK
ncbi:DUF4350 domain-containing protein [Fluviicola sp. SGL-29]|nr:DUF4350 domain-containing protein [Fluviicola sp. SGL-29]